MGGGRLRFLIIVLAFCLLLSGCYGYTGVEEVDWSVFDKYDSVLPTAVLKGINANTGDLFFIRKIDGELALYSINHQRVYFYQFPKTSISFSKSAENYAQQADRILRSLEAANNSPWFVAGNGAFFFHDNGDLDYMLFNSKVTAKDSGKLTMLRSEPFTNFEKLAEQAHEMHRYYPGTQIVISTNAQVYGVNDDYLLTLTGAGVDMIPLIGLNLYVEEYVILDRYVDILNEAARVNEYASNLSASVVYDCILLSPKYILFVTDVGNIVCARETGEYINTL